MSVQIARFTETAKESVRDRLFMEIAWFQNIKQTSLSSHAKTRHRDKLLEDEQTLLTLLSQIRLCFLGTFRLSADFLYADVNTGGYGHTADCECGFG